MNDKFDYKYLLDIDSPADLRKLPVSALPKVCDEVREFLVDTITSIGGHFGAGLGVVELTTALHYVYNTPRDKIVIDTGHQGYPHKILTGRRDSLKTIRQKGGISGFLKRTESEYDAFGAGHASTSISAALGLATARDMNGEDYKVIAVIGDGALTGGLAFEALNNAGFLKKDITVVLNDNNMSIAPNVSAMSNYFNELFASNTLQRMRENIWDLSNKLDNEVGDRLRKIAHRLEDGVKAIITPGVMFEALGFNYIGPVNGNNVHKLVKILSSIKDFKGPVLLHVVSQKGYGYKPAVSDKQFLHAIGKIDKVTGKSLAKKPDIAPPPNYQDVFGETVLDFCKKSKNICAITAGMPDGTGLNIVQKEMPERVYDVGIAEGHAVTFAAGLACEGIVPIVAIYSTFMQRAIDHLIHDVALQKLHVVFALDRAGLVGADGPTHHGVLDLSYLRPIQGMILMAPKDELELRDMMYSAVYEYKGPIAIRFPRGASLGLPKRDYQSLPLGKGEILRQGSEVAIIAIGKMVNESLAAAEKLTANDIEATVVNARFVKPLDTDLLDQIALTHDYIITVEENQKQAGFGSAVLEYFAEKGYKNNFKILGLPDKIIDHGTQEELLAELGLDASGIANSVKNFVANQVNIY